jgi:hypothetical protein
MPRSYHTSQIINPSNHSGCYMHNSALVAALQNYALRFLQQLPSTSLNSITGLVCVMEKRCVFVCVKELTPHG